GEDAERAADEHGGHDGEAVEPVGQVDRVGGADDDEEREHHEADGAERIGDVLEEGNDELVQRRGGLGHVGEVAGGGKAYQRLPEKLRPRREALGIAVHHLAVVVDPADDPEGERHEQHDPYEAVREVAPEKRGEHDGDQDERSAHRRRAGLGEVRARAVVAHGLADLVGRQLADHVRAEPDRDRERREAREDRPQRDVVEDVEDAGVLCQPLRELEEHQCPPWSAAPVSAATTRSMRMKREPFTSTVRPSMASTSDSRRSKCRPPGPNAATACALASPSPRSELMPRAAAYAPTSRWKSLPCSPTSPMSPSTRTLGPSQAASTSIAARTE